MNILSAIGASHAFYLAFLLFKKGDKSVSDKLLLLLFILYGVVFSIVYISFEYIFEDLIIFLINANLILVPTYYLYMRSVVTAQKLGKKDVIFFLPYIFTTLYWVSLFLYYDEYQLIKIFSQDSIFNNSILFIVSVLTDTFAMPTFILFMILHQKNHIKAIYTNYSYTEGIDYSWLRITTTIIFIDWLITNPIPLLFGAGIHNENVIKNSTAISTLLLFIVGYYGLKKGYLYSSNFKTPARSESKSKKAAIPDSQIKSHLKKLDHVIQSDKPYLNNTLSLSELSDLTGISKHSLSWIINEKMGKNFYDYINYYRIEEFKNRVLQKEYEKFTLLSIALDCGFNSKATFNRLFKKYTGITPSQFVKNTQV